MRIKIDPLSENRGRGDWKRMCCHDVFIYFRFLRLKIRNRWVMRISEVAKDLSIRSCMTRYIFPKCRVKTLCMIKSRLKIRKVR
jgi:hypothetical protein